MKDDTFYTAQDIQMESSCLEVTDILELDE